MNIIDRRGLIDIESFWKIDPNDELYLQNIYGTLYSLYCSAVHLVRNKTFKRDIRILEFIHDYFITSSSPYIHRILTIIANKEDNGYCHWSILKKARRDAGIHDTRSLQHMHIRYITNISVLFFLSEITIIVSIEEFRQTLRTLIASNNATNLHRIKSHINRDLHKYSSLLSDDIISDAISKYTSDESAKNIQTIINKFYQSDSEEESSTDESSDSEEESGTDESSDSNSE